MIKIARHYYAYAAKFTWLSRTAVMIYMALLMGFQIYTLLLLPASGWDSLTFWLKEAHIAVADLISTEIKDGKWIHPQPKALIQLVASVTRIGFAYQYLWFLASAIFCILCLHLGRAGQKWEVQTFLLTAFIFGVPLWEAHVLLVGYADLFVAAAFGIAIGFARESLDQPTLKHHVAFLFALYALASVKNTGTAYVLLVLVTLLQTVAMKRHRNRQILKLSTLIFSLAIPILFSGYLDGRSLVYAGNTLRFLDPGISDLITNWRVALVENMSFTVIPIIIFLVLFENLPQEVSRKTCFTVSAGLNLFIMLTLSQFTEYGYQNAVPSHDTGNSRFFLPIVPVALYLLIDALKNYERFTPRAPKNSASAPSPPCT